MVADCSEGMHGRQLCYSVRAAARARHGWWVGSFALWRPDKERPRAQLFASDAQQLAASSTALWQPGLARAQTKLGIEKIGRVGLASCKDTSKLKPQPH